ncbi:MAG: hypothetical protein HOK72_04470 [Flavobacteriales bacterium]|jgi:hypothetical protein|nr:hypothetical protein [Flavobacteriales bacterium]
MKASDMELIFIYNAGSGLFDSVSDFAHKILSPSTYQCNLCVLTHGNFGAKKQWKDFLKKLGIKVEFYYKNQFKNLNQNEIKPPCILIKIHNSTIQEFINADEMNSHESLDDLIDIIKVKLKQYK